MQTYSDGWSNWEDQLNRKTERRRKAAAKHTRIRHRAALIIELLLFAIAAALIVLEGCGIIPAIISLPLTALVIVFMSFCAGIVVGAKNN